MKNILILITALFTSNLAFAGNGSGTMIEAMRSLTNRNNVRPSEIVYHMGEKDGVVKFAYGQLANGQWDIRKLEIPAFDVSNMHSLKMALDASINSKNWVTYQELN